MKYLKKKLLSVMMATVALKLEKSWMKDEGEQNYSSA